MSVENGSDQEEFDGESLRTAKENFGFESVRLYQRVFLKETVDDSRFLTFSQAEGLLTRMDFRFYGDGKYPLSHYLREVVKAGDTVSFPNFVQAISMSISRPIPLCYKEGFEDMDLDHNGKLDAREVFNMMKTLSDVCYSWADVEDFLESTDVDQDGKMDYPEMLRAVYFST